MASAPRLGRCGNLAGRLNLTGEQFLQLRQPLKGVHLRQRAGKERLISRRSAVLDRASGRFARPARRFAWRLHVLVAP